MTKFEIETRRRLYVFIKKATVKSARCATIARAYDDNQSRSRCYGVYYPRQEGHGETLKLVSQGMNKRGIKGTDYTEKKLFTLYTLRSVFIFSLLFSVHLLRC